MSKRPVYSVEYIGHGKYGLYSDGELLHEYENYDECMDMYEDLLENPIDI